MVTSFSTRPSDWQSMNVDDEPTAGSSNLIESGGVYKEIDYIKNGRSIKSLVDSFIDKKIINNWGQYADTTNGRYFCVGDIDISLLVGKEIMIHMDTTVTSNYKYAIIGLSDNLIAIETITDSDKSITIPNNASILRVSVIAANLTVLADAKASFSILYEENGKTIEEVWDAVDDVNEIKNGIEDGTIYKNNTIAPEKTNFMTKIESTNYLNMSALTLGHYMGVDGVTHEGVELCYTENIKVNEGDIITFQCVTGTGAQRGIYSMRFVTAFNNGVVVASAGSQLTESYTVPTGIDTIVVSLFMSMIADGRFPTLTKSNTVIPYEPYFPMRYVLPAENISPEITELIDDKVELSAQGLLIKNVMCIGDSLTQGSYYGTTDGHIAGTAIIENYPYQLSRLTDWNIVNTGVSGYSPINWWDALKNPESLPQDIRPIFENIDFSQHDAYLIWFGNNTRVYVSEGQSLTYTDMTTGTQTTITTGQNNVQVVVNAPNTTGRLMVDRVYVATGWTYINGYIEDPDGVRYDGILNDLTDTLDTDVIPYQDYEDFVNTATGCYCKIISKIVTDNPQARIFLATVFFGNDATNCRINEIIGKIAALYQNKVVGVVDCNVAELKLPINHIPSDNVHFSKVGNVALALHWQRSVCTIVKNNQSLFERLLL